ncbi:MAG TPA: 2OG-Fe dioxygenase family protein [Kofleriaceae bacterium]|nr:2OG-Fe dioxygenase family protein [Kofleriaceae bacterium]
MVEERSLLTTLRTAGYAFVDGGEMARLLGPLADWDAFAASWNDLHLDTYMADGGRYRRRRHALYAIAGEAITRKPHGPHWQSKLYNPLHGDLERWFEPVTDAIGASQSMTTILAWSARMFDRLLAVPRWDVEVHQFRIEARAGEAGNPTPEGPHRDGVDYVLVLMIRRVNIVEGTTTIHDLAGRQLGSFTLTAPLDAALVEDARVYHGVTPVEPEDPARDAYRDVLVVTFKRPAA